MAWHSHDDTDELFLVLSGELTIQMRDRDVVLGPRELFVVPRGAEHCPRADTEDGSAPAGASNVVNTGDAGGAFTAEAETLSRRSPCGPIRMGGPVFRAHADQREGGWPTVPAARGSPGISHGGRGADRGRPPG